MSSHTSGKMTGKLEKILLTRGLAKWLKMLRKCLTTSEEITNYSQTRKTNKWNGYAKATFILEMKKMVK
jgi:hypothetical protein